MNETLIDQIEHFFISYNEAKGKKFNSLGHFGAIKAKKIVEEGIAVYHQKINLDSKVENLFHNRAFDHSKKQTVGQKFARCQNSFCVYSITHLF